MRKNVFEIILFFLLSVILLTSYLMGCSFENKPNEDLVKDHDVNLSPNSYDGRNGEETKKNVEKDKEMDKDSLIAKAYAYALKQPINHNETLEDEQFNLKAVENVRAVGMITGESSENRTRSTYQVGGTDLGIFVEHKDKMYLFFGDTFRGDDKGNPMEGGAWRCNVLAYTTDFDASDGITFDGMISSKNAKGENKPYAKELISAKKIPGNEHTVIPTGGFSDGKNLYTYFMSVKQWDGPGGWTINYGGLAKSNDDGQSFKKLPDIKFDDDKFGQIAPLQVGDYLYCIGIPGGRFSSARLMRVKMGSVEDIEAYEYFAGMDGEEPIFKKGFDKMDEAVEVANGPIGEPSIMYNEYLGEYVMTYLEDVKKEGDIGSIVMRVASELWGPWSEPLVLVDHFDYPALYGGFIHEKYTKEDGKYFYFTMSLWDPVYNSGILEVEVSRKKDK